MYIPHFPRKSEQTPHQAQIFRTFFEDRGNIIEKTDQLILFRFMGLLCYGSSKKKQCVTSKKKQVFLPD